MEAFALYLFKSVIWLTGFTLVFILFLRNERYFFLNRIYLITGILTSFLFPLISVHYTVVLPVTSNLQVDNAVAGEIQKAGNNIVFDLKLLLFVLYMAGVFFILSLIIRQGRSLLRAIKKSEIITLHSVKLLKTPEYTSPFSFFSYVFVNPSITDIETKEIMIHELVHIRQKHWIDLVLVELLCMMQWFNPLAWIYVRLVRQNHEYLADEVALQQTSDPAIYRAVLLNQIVGAPVVSLANSFNYSINKKRFSMMKNIISSPYRKMKILLILPVFAIVLYAFAKPDYKYNYVNENSGNSIIDATSLQKGVNGIVQQQNGESLPGATIMVKGTTIGAVTDAKGHFSLGNIPDDGLLVVSFVGFKSKVLKPDLTTDMVISMIRDTVALGTITTTAQAPPPPPPPPTDANFRGDGPPPLYVVDGVIVTQAEAEKIDPGSIASMTVLKDKSGSKSASDKYGEKGKNGVIEITTKKDYLSTGKMVPDIKVTGYGTEQKTDKDNFVAVEEMPAFPGGNSAMTEWIVANCKYPAEAKKGNITGKVLVSFMVTSAGKVKDVSVIKSASPLLNAEAIRVISSMPDWKPGKQGGKAVSVQMRVPVEFKLH